MRTTLAEGNRTTPIWSDRPDPRPLEFVSPPPAETDVCIVGAGIAGLTTALALLRRGTRVMILDDGPFGGGESGRTTAHLASAVDDRYYRLERSLGARAAQLVAESHTAAINTIEHTVHELGIECDFKRVDGFLFGPPGSKRGQQRSVERILDRELLAATRAGLAVERVEHTPFPFAVRPGPALRFANQAQFHPLAYLRGLVKAIVALGGSIHEGVHVRTIEAGMPLVVVIVDDRGERRIRCRAAVDATNAAITSPVKLTTRLGAYRSYVLGFDVQAGHIPNALYWDTAKPYHYLRVAPGEHGREILIVGGNDHRVGQGDPKDSWEQLESWTRQWIPDTGRIVARWSGQILEPSDGLAYIGPSPDIEHVYVVTGDSGNGLTHGTIAGLLLPELMQGRVPAWAEVYDPRRSRAQGFGSMIAEAARSTVPYVDWLRRGDVRSAEDIPRGQGAVVRRGLQLVAVFRDEAGLCTECSAACPHLRGVVHWNAGEKTWDCPCHGSRFDPYGQVVNGPATMNLAPILDHGIPAQLDTAESAVQHAEAPGLEAILEPPHPIR